MKISLQPINNKLYKKTSGNAIPTIQVGYLQNCKSIQLTVAVILCKCCVYVPAAAVKMV